MTSDFCPFSSNSSTPLLTSEAAEGKEVEKKVKELCAPFSTAGPPTQGSGGGGGVAGSGEEAPEGT